MRERVQAAKSPSRCPYCHDDLKVEKDIVACAPCGARHHRGCHAEHGRCASCGAEEALYPREQGERRSDPPRGSKIEVVQEDGRTAYRWSPRAKGDIVLLVLLCIILFPLGLYLLYKRQTDPQRSLELSPEGLKMKAVKQGGMSVKDLSFPRDEVDRVRIIDFAGTSSLTIDHGVDRYVLSTGALVPALTAPELEWLAEQIQSWLEEA